MAQPLHAPIALADYLAAEDASPLRHEYLGGGKVATDATLIVELLSDSTAGTDRREKRVACMRLPGLRSYWIVSQDEQRVEVHERSAGGSWLARDCGPGDAPAASGLDIAALPVVDLYAGTDLA